MEQWDDSWSHEEKLAWVDARLVEMRLRATALGLNVSDVDAEIERLEATLGDDEDQEGS